MIDIKGKDKAKLLQALFNASKQLGLGFFHTKGRESMTIEEAQALLEENEKENSHYFDYIHGRVMKLALNKDELNPWGYDRDNGQGAAAKAIKGI